LILVNARSVSETDAVALQRALPKHICLRRLPKAWVTSAVLTEYIRLLAKALEPWRQTCDFIVAADTYKAHLTQVCLRTWGRFGFRFLVTPAGLTWALQPCDTHVFARLKQRLHVLAQLRRLQSAAQRPELRDTIFALSQAIDQVVCSTSWETAFVSAGLCGHQQHLSPRVQQIFALEDTVAPRKRTLPAWRDLETLFPKNMHIPVSTLFSFFTGSRNRNL